MTLRTGRQDPSDLGGRTRKVNSRYCEITGWSSEELRGMTRDDISHPDDRDVGKEIARQVRSGERASGVVARGGIRKDGSVFWADPGKFGFAGVLGKPYLFADVEQALAAVTGEQPR